MIVKEKNTKIIESYMYTDDDIEKLVDRLIYLRKNKKYPVTRSKESYIREIKTHNRLYKLHILRERTKDTDLEEPISKIKEILYFILGAW